MFFGPYDFLYMFYSMYKTYFVDCRARTRRVGSCRGGCFIRPQSTYTTHTMHVILTGPPGKIEEHELMRITE
jgi:hypothetical protein